MNCSKPYPFLKALCSGILGYLLECMVEACGWLIRYIAKRGSMHYAIIDDGVQRQNALCLYHCKWFYHHACMF